MNKETIVETAKDLVENKGYDDGDIQFIALTGSILLKDEDDLGDVDVLVSIKDTGSDDIQTERKDIDGLEHHFFFEDLDRYEKRLKFEVEDRRARFNIYNDFYDVIYGENPFDFDPFKYRDEYEEIIKEVVKPVGFNRKSTRSDPMWKSFVAPYLFFRVIDNDKYELTDDMISTARSIYDGDPEQIDIVRDIGERLGLRLNYRIRNKYYPSQDEDEDA